MRQILGVYSAPRQHWVGDGFPVRTMLSHAGQGADVSPFLMLDYAGPATFTQTNERRGVGEHPHKGFETVTIVYHGEDAVGRVTSGGFSPTLGHPIAMGYVMSDHAGEGTELTIEVRNKRLPAKVAKLPFVPHRYHRGN